MDEKKQIEAGKAPKPPNRPPTLTDLEHAGHDRALREVAREEVVVRGHALVADRVDARLPLEDAVDEEEGVAGRWLEGWRVEEGVEGGGVSTGRRHTRRRILDAGQSVDQSTNRSK